MDEFPEFLEPLVAELGRSERREGATLYVQGLLLPGERKSIEPMAERLGTDSQKLQQFIADSPWDEARGVAGHSAGSGAGDGALGGLDH